MSQIGIFDSFRCQGYVADSRPWVANRLLSRSSPGNTSRTLSTKAVESRS
jgi:hypothetical protein